MIVAWPYNATSYYSNNALHVMARKLCMHALAKQNSARVVPHGISVNVL